MTDNFPKINFVGLDGILVQFSDEICESANSAALALRHEVEQQNQPAILESANSLTAAYFRVWNENFSGSRTMSIPRIKLIERAFYLLVIWWFSRTKTSGPVRLRRRKLWLRSRSNRVPR